MAVNFPHVVFNLFAEMLTEFVQFLPFGFQKFTCDPSGFLKCFFKSVVIPAADFLGFIFGNVTCLSEYRG